LEERASALRLSTPLVGVWRCRGLMSRDAGEAAAAFATAYSACDGPPMPFDWPALCSAKVSCSAGIANLARPARPLRSSAQLFERLGAQLWADRATAELSATGDRNAARPHPSGMETLTGATAGDRPPRRGRA